MTKSDIIEYDDETRNNRGWAGSEKKFPFSEPALRYQLFIWTTLDAAPF